MAPSVRRKKKGTTMKMPAGSLAAVCLQKLLSSLTLYKKLRDQRSSSVQMNMQYCYLAVIEYGNAMEYIDSPELSEEFAKFKAELEFNTQPPTAPKKSSIA